MKGPAAPACWNPARRRRSSAARFTCSACNPSVGRREADERRAGQFVQVVSCVPTGRPGEYGVRPRGRAVGPVARWRGVNDSAAMQPDCSCSPGRNSTAVQRQEDRWAGLATVPATSCEAGALAATQTQTPARQFLHSAAQPGTGETAGWPGLCSFHHSSSLAHHLISRTQLISNGLEMPAFKTPSGSLADSLII